MMNQTELEGQSEVTILGAAGKGNEWKKLLQYNRRHVLSICLIPLAAEVPVPFE